MSSPRAIFLSKIRSKVLRFNSQRGGYKPLQNHYNVESSKDYFSPQRIGYKPEDVLRNITWNIKENM